MVMSVPLVVGDGDADAVAGVGDDQLTGETGPVRGAIGEVEQVSFLVRDLGEQVCGGGVDVDVAGRAGAAASALGDDAGQVVADRAVHEALPDGNVDNVLGPVGDDVGDTGHGQLLMASRRETAGSD